MQTTQNRRTFIAGLSAAGSAGLFNIRPSSAVTGEPPPETTSVRLGKPFAYCWASVFLAGELLRAEGINVQYVEGDPTVDNAQWLARGEVDFDMNMPSMHVTSIEAGIPIKVLTGIHSGCFELIASKNIRSVADLRGKRVGVWQMDTHPQKLAALMANYVGLDPVREIQWIVVNDSVEAFNHGKIDAFISGPPETQLLRVQKSFLGHTVVNITTDRPWSQYYCCMIAGSAEYVNKNPVATKRILRAMLKSADLCASNPELAARELIDRGFLPNFDYALAALRELPHGIWRDYDPEDSVRFYALRMRETGMIKSSPQQIIERGADWRHINALKRELKT